MPVPNSARKLIASIRRNEHHQIDDVAVDCDLFRLERMDRVGLGELIWMAVEKDGKRIVFHLESDAPIWIAVLADDLTPHVRRRKTSRNDG
jgi:hypothetical protein